MSNTEELYPMLLPEDENGLEWHLVNMTKEELIATLEANSCKNDSVSELILEYNQEYIAEFNLEVVKYSDASFQMKFEKNPDFAETVLLAILLFPLLIGSIVAWVVHFFDWYW